VSTPTWVRGRDRLPSVVAAQQLGFSDQYTAGLGVNETLDLIAVSNYA